MNEARLVSIDSSSKRTGMALFVNGKLIEYQLIDLSKSGLEIGPRILEMGKQIMALLSHWRPEMVYIEEPKGHQNVELVRKLAEVIGIVKGWCVISGTFIDEIKPSVWRKYCGFEQGGKKRAELKAESIEYVKSKYGIEVTDDVADAICIGDAVLNFYKE